MKRSFSIMMLGALCALTPCFALAGCGGINSDSYDITVTLIGGKEGIYVNSEGTHSVSSGETETITVYFSSGYDHSNISITVNGDSKTGEVYYSEDNTVVGDSPDFSKSRTVNLILEDINENKDVNIDVSNCNLVDKTITLSEDIRAEARYALKKENALSYDFLTGLSSNVVNIYNVPVTGEIKIPYGFSFWLLLNHVEGDVSGINRAYLYGKPYKYGNQDVYYSSNVYDDFEVSKNVGDNDVGDEFNYNLNTFTIVPANDSNYINFNVWTDVGVSQEDSNIVNVNGTNIKQVTSYNLSYYLYIGEEENPQNDPVLDLNFNENNGLTETKNWISSKMYIELQVNEQLSFDAFDFFISRDRYGVQAKSVESNIVEVDNKHFLILDKSDVEEFIVQKEGYESGCMFLVFKVDQDYLAENMFGAKVEYTKDVNKSTRENKTFFSTKSSGTDYYNGLIQYESMNEVLYYPKSLIQDNKLFLELGGQNDIDCQHYTGATVLVKSASGTLLKTINTTFEGDEIVNNRKTVEIDLTDITESKIILSVTYQNKSADISNHRLSFEHLNLGDGQKLYISTDLSVAEPVWTEVDTNTDNLYISASQPIYYYITSGENSSLKFKISLEKLNYIVDSGFVTDIENTEYFVRNEENAVAVCYARIAENLWIEENCVIYVTF